MTTVGVALMGAFLLLLGCRVSITRSDMPKCTTRPGTNRHLAPDNMPYCLPSSYDKDVVPPTDQSSPLLINVDLFVFEVSKIDDISLAMTFELYFDLRWRESRLILNTNSTEWTVDGVMGSTNFVKELWLPDVQIFNLKQFTKRTIVQDVAGLIIFPDKSILYTVSTEAVVSCPMKFNAYPLDSQECKFRVGSYIHDETQILFTGTFGHDEANQRAQQYEIKIERLDDRDKTIRWAQRNFSHTGFKVLLTRRRTPVLLQTYLPSGLFVVVSWISFIVPPEVVPGRMALLITLFLVLVNIFNSVTANAPKAEGLTAVETWVIMCILHVFGVLAEYAIILKSIQTARRRRDANVRQQLTEEANRSNRVIVVDAGNSNNDNKVANDIEMRPEVGRRQGSFRAVPVSTEGNNNEGNDNNNGNNNGNNEGNTEGNNRLCMRHRITSSQHLVRMASNNETLAMPFDHVAVNQEPPWNQLDLSERLPNRRHRGNNSIVVGQTVGNRCQNLDLLALWLFPCIFFVFNLIYWAYYLNVLEQIGLELL